MSNITRTLSAALLSSSLLVAGAGLAQASDLVGHPAVDQINTESGTQTIHSPATYAISQLGPHAVSEQALNMDTRPTHPVQALKVSAIGPHQVSKLALVADGYVPAKAQPAHQLASRAN